MNCVTLLNIKSARLQSSHTDLFRFGKDAYGRVSDPPYFEHLSVTNGNLYSLCRLCRREYNGLLSTHLSWMFMLGSSLALNIALSLPIIGGLTLLPNLHSLGPVSEIAMLLMFTAFAILGVVVGTSVSDRQDELPGVNWTEAPLAICAILYSFEGICIVLPLEATMKQQKSSYPSSLRPMSLLVDYCLMGGVWFRTLERSRMAALRRFSL